MKKLCIKTGFFVLMLSLGLLQVNAQRSEDFIIGNWMGNIEFQSRKLAIVIRVIDIQKDSVIAFMDSPDQGAKDIKVSKITIKDDSVYIRVKSLGVSINGILNTKDSIISGQFKQSIFKCPLTLKKTDVVPERKRPQEPKPPYPYHTKDVSFMNTVDNIEFSATLTYPDGSGRFPAVVLISGSGPQNRDEELLGHKPFWVLADYLSRNGIAVLRYDDRGTAKSKGDFSNGTTYDFARDAEAAFNYLKTLDNVDTARTGLIGHSEGGMIAPLIASRNKSVRFIVLLAGPGLSGKDIILKQSALISRASGETEEKIQKSTALNEEIYKIVLKEKDNSKAKANIRKLLDEYAEKLGNDEKMAFAGQKDMMTQQVLSPWFRAFLAFDPKPYLSKTHCAVLALNGANDLQVPPDEDLAAIEKYLKKAGNKNFTVKKLPRLNHLFQTSETGSPNDYIKIEETFSPDALLLIKNWILNIVK